MSLSTLKLYPSLRKSYFNSDMEELTHVSHSTLAVAPAKTKAIDAQRLISAIRPAATGSPSHTNRSTPPRALPEPQTCRHWCTHGICKWGQQCRYRHIMPMTLSGLRELGLHDWPTWYRDLNPGYFASKDTHHLKLHHSRAARREKGRRCSGKWGCCGGLNFDLEASHGRAEGLRNAVSSREREMARRAELGEVAFAKLRGSVVKDGKEGVTEKREKAVSGTVMLERAAIKDARDWEEESSEASEGKEEVFEKKKVEKSSLLD